MIEEAAQRLREANENKVVCQPIRDLLGESNLAAAYAVQKINTKYKLSKGARVVGAKIGLTSKVVQEQLGVHQPDYGLLFDDMEIMNGGEISCSELMQPKAEGEIAFILGKDLDGNSITTIDVLQAIDYVVASIEIVGSRIANWNIRITDTIADNASSSHFVIGHRPVRLENIDVINCTMEMRKNGELVSTGSGAACLGSPLTATLWLAKTMSSLNKPLRAGDLIMSGALGPVVTVGAGDRIEASFSGLGTVSVGFTD